MQARSAESLKQTAEAWEPVVRSMPGRAGELAGQINAVIDILDDSTALRRDLTDPSRSAEARAALVRQILGGKVVEEVLDLITGMARRGWSADADIADALSEIGGLTLMISAEQAGRLDQVISELHGIVRLMDSNVAVRGALTDRVADPALRVELVERLFGEIVVYETLQIARRVLGSPRTKNPVWELLEIIDEAAARSNKLVASVRAAVPLTDEQISRLAATLERRYGKPVDVQVGIDPEVIGGLRVRVGSDQINDTIARRLEDARRRMSA